MSQAVHQRLSVLSTASLPAGVAGDRSSLSTPPPAARLSLPASSSTLTLTPRSSIAASAGGGAVPNIYDRNLNKTRTAEVSAAAFTFFFSEMIQYTQKRVNGIGDLERRYASSSTQSG
jgi:trafficking protein particle complex subunit 5